MNKKIKITEEQLKFLMEQSQEQRISHDSDLPIKSSGELEELGGFFKYEKKNDFRRKTTKMPDPYEMAEQVANKIDLHPKYYKDEIAYRQFVDALYEVLSTKADTGEAFVDKEDNGIVSNDQLNEFGDDFEQLKSSVGDYMKDDQTSFIDEKSIITSSSVNLENAISMKDWNIVGDVNNDLKSFIEKNYTSKEDVDVPKIGDQSSVLDDTPDESMERNSGINESIEKVKTTFKRFI